MKTTTGTNRPLCTAVLVLYVAGALLLPALHKYFSGCVCADGMNGLVRRCCPASHAHGDNIADDPQDAKPDKPPHDPATCAICQLANIPIHTASMAIATPQNGPVEPVPPAVFRQPDIQTPRLHPFSCGPPAWLHSPGII
ncbi:MAG: hypothetical protein ACOX5G_10775 [Kiritimatiellia bacterium]|jgi:hypothetical protein